MHQKLENSYDAVAYDTQAIRPSHPDRMSAIGNLFGLTPPVSKTAKILEIGCGNGNNCISLAYAYPNASFLAFDFANKPIELGKQKIQALNLKNIELRALNILDFDSSFGKFDYIICHGIFSWVPEDVRHHILKILKENLSPSGMAYVSYNTYPGWHIRGMATDMLRFATSTGHSLADAKTHLLRLEALLKTHGSFPISALPEELLTAAKQPEWYLTHDYLSEPNQPFYFYEFIELLKKYDLQHIVDSDLSKLPPQDLTPESLSILGKIAPDWIAANQYLDFFRNTMFRRSLICSSSLKINRKISTDSLMNCHLSTLLSSGASDLDMVGPSKIKFDHPNGGAMLLDEPSVKIAIHEMSKLWPQTISLTDLTNLVSGKLLLYPGTPVKIKEALLRAILCDFVDMYITSPALDSYKTLKPKSSSLARYDSKVGPNITCLRHECVALDSLEMAVLHCADGTKSIEEILNQVDALKADADPRGKLQSILQSLSRKCLLEKSS